MCVTESESAGEGRNKGKRESKSVCHLKRVGLFTGPRSPSPKHPHNNNGQRIGGCTVNKNYNQDRNHFIHQGSDALHAPLITSVF